MRRDIQITLGDSDATGCIPLRVDINNQNLFSLNGQACCQVYIRGRFPNTTLLIENSYCFSNDFLLIYLKSFADFFSAVILLYNITLSFTTRFIPSS